MKGSLSLVEHFSCIPDPRSTRTRRHKLQDVLAIATCAMLCGAETFVEMEEFARCKEAWLRERLELPGGIPSHDTFNRIFARMDPTAYHECFLGWIEALQEDLRAQQQTGEQDGELNEQIIALDGKTLRRSFDRASQKSALHMVSAWSSVNSLTLGQRKVDGKSNEITAIPALLHLLDLRGCIVTIDAMGCQKEIARRIVEQQGDYVLGLKGNQPTLHQNVERFFLEEENRQFKDQPNEYYETTEKDHGRIEKRRYRLVELSTTIAAELPKEAVKVARWWDPDEEWTGLHAIGMVESSREINGKASIQKRYFITSLKGGVKRFAQAQRGHWGIENRVHWLLDVAYAEDQCRVRVGNAPENLSTLRKMTLNLLKQETTRKVGIKVKRNKAGWDDRYLSLVLAGPTI